ncbi:MAG: cob(I)yrinic acid a,c-diamide adenosyltransferase [Bdellovibrionales bacterium]|nr:cob(I)yrinic acid a,c-diamide adenosyltransferase [Bdellovibrionales bacterium]
MKIYTKKGDKGRSQLVDGSQVSKATLRLISYGNLDELNSHLGLLITHLDSHSVFEHEMTELVRIQEWLFQLGSQLACADEDMAAKLPTITQDDIEALEKQIDRYDKELPQLRNFILPGGDIAAVQAHICRTVCRRTERSCVALNDQEGLEYPAIPFLNRLSDYFFTLSRWINHRLGIANHEWKPQ